LRRWCWLPMPSLTRHWMILPFLPEPSAPCRSIARLIGENEMVQQLCYGSSWEVGDSLSLVESKLQSPWATRLATTLVDAS
jgi:hypothetical protein